MSSEMAYTFANLLPYVALMWACSFLYFSNMIYNMVTSDEDNGISNSNPGKAAEKEA